MIQNIISANTVRVLCFPLVDEVWDNIFAEPSPKIQN